MRVGLAMMLATPSPFAASNHTAAGGARIPPAACRLEADGRRIPFPQLPPTQRIAGRLNRCMVALGLQ